ncbi:hypothetical protein JB92DRAFT_3144615 [Gautieria morchelliformis]|nr:hypothetical protein JB92DRAFT_3144615 [Gautieria morchelliformis]
MAMASNTTQKKARRGPHLTYLQRQLAHQTAKRNRESINSEVDAMLALIDQEAKRLSVKYRHSPAWFQHQFYQGGRVVRKRRAVSVFNAAQQIDLFLEGRKGELTEEEKIHFQEIKAKLHELNGAAFACNLPIEMQQFLKAKTQAWRVQKHTAFRANTRAVVQDSRYTLERDELNALTARTDMQTMLFAGKPEHTMDGFFAASEKGSRYLLHGMKKNASDIVKEFEAYALGDVQGIVLNHNARLADIKGKIHGMIREGLASITGDPKITMQFERYEKIIVVGRGVEIINWPDGVPFVTSSEIGSLHDLHRLQTALTLDDADKRCRWATSSETDWENRKAAYYEAADKAPPKKRKRQVRAESEEDLSSDEGNAAQHRQKTQHRSEGTGSGEGSAGGQETEMDGASNEDVPAIGEGAKVSAAAKGRKALAIGKENEVSAAGNKQAGVKERGKGKGKAKGAATSKVAQCKKGAKAPLVSVDKN